MTAPQIPNLLDTLRTSKTSRGARISKRPENNAPSRDAADKIVQGTDSDAAGSRLSAVSLGYLDDAFAEAFLPAGLVRNARRMPIINRGTYVRTMAIDRLVWQFVDAYPAQRVQIVSLGAGTDTRFFRMVQTRPNVAERLVYHEVDFGVTNVGKVRAIERTPAIIDLLRSAAARAEGIADVDKARLDIAEDRTSLTSAVYSVHALDLRSLVDQAPTSTTTQTTETRLDVSPNLPTLVVSECCLTYLQTQTSEAILHHLASKVFPSSTPLEIIQYEPLHPHDAFGRTMISNLAARGISVPGVEGVPTLEAHKERLKKTGFLDIQDAWEIKEIWDGWVAENEKERLRHLEMVDEEEEWMLLAGHYGIVRAKRDGDNATAPVK